MKRRLLTILTRTRHYFLQTLPWEALTNEEKWERQRLGSRPARMPFEVLSPAYFREHPLLAKANLCRLLGMRRMEELFLERAAAELAVRCETVPPADHSDPARWAE